MAELANCPRCGAAVVYVHYGKTGNLGVIDAEPAVNGDHLILDGKLYVDTGDIFESYPPGPRHSNHHDKCPAMRKLRAGDATKGLFK